MKPRIGVFGGAFDPPHNAHVALAKAAMAQRGLAELRVFPTGQSWHKRRTPSDAAHRLAMAHLAFDPVAGVVVDDREIRRDGPTYTLDTLREIQREHPEAQLVLLMGSDQANALPTWHRWHEILAMAIVCVAERLESPIPEGAIDIDADGSDAVPNFDPHALPGLPACARFETLKLPAVATSATEIRARAARDQDISGLVPLAVARYIDRHHLYASA